MLEQREVPKHAEQREERERDEAACLLARHLPHQLEDAEVRDPVELGAELERRERIEERGLRHLAVRDGERRVEEPERHAREPRHAAGHLEEVRERVAQEEQRLLGRVLRHRSADEA